MCGNRNQNTRNKTTSIICLAVRCCVCECVFSRSPLDLLDFFFSFSFRTFFLPNGGRRSGRNAQCGPRAPHTRNCNRNSNCNQWLYYCYCYFSFHFSIFFSGVRLAVCILTTLIDRLRRARAHTHVWALSGEHWTWRGECVQMKPESKSWTARQDTVGCIITIKIELWEKRTLWNCILIRWRWMRVSAHSHLRSICPVIFMTCKNHLVRHTCGADHDRRFARPHQ